MTTNVVMARPFEVEIVESPKHFEVHEPNDLPADMRNDFEEITRELTAVEPVGDEGSVRASTNAMTDIEASETNKRMAATVQSTSRS